MNSAFQSSNFLADRVYLASGVAGGLRASIPAGVILKWRFAWSDPITGQVSNVWSGDPSQSLGIPLVEPERLMRNGWQIATYDDGLWTLRAGVGCSLAIQGDFWMPLTNGGAPGNHVYANQLDGSAGTAAGAGFTLTPWRVMTYASPGNRALISSWYNPFGG